MSRFEVNMTLTIPSPPFFFLFPLAQCLSVALAPSLLHLCPTLHHAPCTMLRPRTATWMLHPAPHTLLCFCFYTTCHLTCPSLCTIPLCFATHYLLTYPHPHVPAHIHAMLPPSSLVHHKLLMMQARGTVGQGFHSHQAQQRASHPRLQVGAVYVAAC